MPAISRTSSRASASLSLTPFSMTYSKVMRRALLTPRIAAAGRHQLGERIFAVQRHQLVAQLVADRVQRHREVDAELGAGAVHHRHHAGGGQRDAPPRQADAFVVHDDLHRLGDVVVIVQRLAHAHQHDGGEQPRRSPFGLGHSPSASRAAMNWPTISAGAEVAHQRLRAGVAEPAGQRAADLARRRRRRRDPPRGCRRSRPPARRGSGTAICGSRRALVCTVATAGRPITNRRRASPAVGLAIEDMRAKSVTPW